MRRWWPVVLALGLVVFAVLARRSSSAALLEDSDTRVMLAAIAERGDPLSWFAGDWPLENHFYRPLAALTFEADFALHGREPAGFGLTNALLCCAALSAFAWVASEALRSPLPAALAVGLFGAWHLDFGQTLCLWATSLWAPIAALALYRAAVSRALRAPDFAAVLATSWLAAEVAGPSPLKFRILDWLPGRTATTMTVFALIAIGAWLRFERLRRWDSPPAYDPLDVPPGRNSAGPAKPRGLAAWPLTALAATLLALATYEQAVVVPPILTGASILWARRGGRVPSYWLATLWAALGYYLLQRYALLSHEVSEYQRQQFRFGPGVWLSILDYAFPAGRGYAALAASWGLGWSVVLLPGVQRAVIGFLGNAFAYAGAARAEHGWVAAGWAASLVAFAPMAFLKPFDHYHYLPMALRAIFVVGLVLVVARMAVNAVAPRARQAPRRPGREPRSPVRP